MDGDGQTTLDQNVPGAVEIGKVVVWVLGGCNDPSVCMQISTTALLKGGVEGEKKDILLKLKLIIASIQTPNQNSGCNFI